MEELEAARQSVAATPPPVPPVPPPVPVSAEVPSPFAPPVRRAAESPSPFAPPVQPSGGADGEAAYGEVYEGDVYQGDTGAAEVGDVYDPATAVHTRASVRSEQMLPHELSPSDVVHEAVSACLQNLVPVLILMVIVSIPSWLYALSLSNLTEPVEGVEFNLARVIVHFMGYAMVVVMTQLLGAAVLTHVMGAWLRDKTLVLYDIIALSLRALLPLLLLSFIQTLLVGLGFLCLIIPGFILSVGWSVAVPAAVEEKLSPMDALRRSWELTAGNWFQIWAAFFILRLTQFAIGFVIGLVAPDLLVVDLVLELIFTSVSAALVALVYFKLRSYKERIPVENLPSVH